MSDTDKTKHQLISELVELRQRTAQLEASQTEYKRTQELLRERAHDLSERVKELNYLYAISDLASKQGISLEEILEGAVDLIPPAWQYPEIACAKITFGDKEFRTDNFETTEWEQSANINVYGQKEGTIEVYYLEARPEIDEGPFLREERLLIDDVAERLGRITERKRAEEKLRDSERRFKELAESITDVFFAFDKDLRYTYWNKASEELTRILANDALGKHLYDIFPDVEMTRRAEEVYQKVLRTKKSQHFVNEYQLEGKDFSFEISAYPTKDGLSVFVKDITQRRQMEEVLTKAKDDLEMRVKQRTAELESLNRDLYNQVTERKRAEDELRHLSHRLVEVEEDERRAIARELHDEIGQSLTVLQLLLDKATRSTAEDVGSTLGEAKTLVNELTVQVRDLSLDLRPSMLDDLGLLASLLWHFERYATQTQVRVNFKHTGLDRHFPPEISIAAYRIVQEALTNTAQHARVGEVTVRAWADKNTLSLQIEDNGIGFDQAALPVGASSGLDGMRERALLLGGKLTVRSAPGAGSHLLAELPLSTLPKKIKKERQG